MSTTPMSSISDPLPSLLRDIRACSICGQYLAAGPRPVLQASSTARILIAAQAPGRKVHESGVPFDDASGERLRRWMSIERDVFYDERVVAILPMGFCYPGKGSSGDLPPRQECAPQWRPRLLAAMPSIQLTLVIGTYAMGWHFAGGLKQTLTEAVRGWRERLPSVVPLPHPSPRNNIWLKANPWFEAEVVPVLQTKVQETLAR